MPWSASCPSLVRRRGRRVRTGTIRYRRAAVGRDLDLILALTLALRGRRQSKVGLLLLYVRHLLNERAANVFRQHFRLLIGVYDVGRDKEDELDLVVRLF